jgi:hypothetical protein
MTQIGEGFGGVPPIIHPAVGWGFKVSSIVGEISPGTVTDHQS